MMEKNNKLRDKFEHEILIGDKLFFITQQLEQITDDFAVKLLVWMANLDHKNDELKHIDYENSSDEQIATELLQIFKENHYE